MVGDIPMISPRKPRFSSSLRFRGSFGPVADVAHPMGRAAQRQQIFRQATGPGFVLSFTFELYEHVQFKTS